MMEDDDAIAVTGLAQRVGGATVLRDVTFRVPRGATVGLVGDSGSGKSTLLGLLGGLLRPWRGVVRVLGRDPRSLGSSGGLAVLPQLLELPAWSRVGEYLAFLAKLTQVDSATNVGRVLDALEIGGLGAKRCADVPQGLKRRVALAAALVGRPRVLLLDEPTAGLERSAARLARAAIRELGDSATVVIASRERSDLEPVCSQIFRLCDGRVAGESKPTAERESTPAIERDTPARPKRRAAMRAVEPGKVVTS